MNKYQQSHLQQKCEDFCNPDENALDQKNQIKKVVNNSLLFQQPSKIAATPQYQPIHHQTNSLMPSQQITNLERAMSQISITNPNDQNAELKRRERSRTRNRNTKQKQQNFMKTEYVKRRRQPRQYYNENKSELNKQSVNNLGVKSMRIGKTTNKWDKIIESTRTQPSRNKKAELGALTPIALRKRTYGNPERECNKKGTKNTLQKSTAEYNDLSMSLSRLDIQPQQQQQKKDDEPDWKVDPKDPFALIRIEGNKVNENVKCDVCLEGDDGEGDEIVICELCFGAVHQSCYGGQIKHKLPNSNEPWYCARCQYLIEQNAQKNNVECTQIRCKFCPDIEGIMKPINQNNEWAHIICVNWMPGVYWNNEYRTKMEGSINPQFSLIDCNYCVYKKMRSKQVAQKLQSNKGMCVPCDWHPCTKQYHVRCLVQMRAIQDYDSMNEKYCNQTRPDQLDGDFPIFCKEHAGKASIFLKCKENGMQILLERRQQAASKIKNKIGKITSTSNLDVKQPENKNQDLNTVQNRNKRGRPRKTAPPVQTALKQVKPSKLTKKVISKNPKVAKNKTKTKKDQVIAKKPKITGLNGKKWNNPMKGVQKPAQKVGIHKKNQAIKTNDITDPSMIQKAALLIQKAMNQQFKQPNVPLSTIKATYNDNRFQKLLNSRSNAKNLSLVSDDITKTFLKKPDEKNNVKNKEMRAGTPYKQRQTQAKKINNKIDI